MLFNPAGDSGAEAKRITVLLVEDEVLVRLCTADTLQSAGYNVLEAANADEAKVLLANFPEIALIFTDIQMPGSIDGAELARFARTAYPTVGILLTSGTVAPSSAPDETVTFVAKPYQPEDVVRRIKSLLK